MIYMATHINHKTYYINSNTLKDNRDISYILKNIYDIRMIYILKDIYMILKNAIQCKNLTNVGYVITWEEHPE